MRSLYKKTIQHFLVAIHFLIMIALFVACWVLFYRTPDKVGISQNYAIGFTYTLVLIFMFRIYHCYKIGFSRVGELVYNQLIANLVSWGITYVLACILMYKILNPLWGFAALALQMLISIGWMVLCNRVYFALHKPKKAAVIFENDQDLKKLEEVRYFEQKWDIAHRIQCMDCSNHHDTPETKAKRLSSSMLADEVVGYDIQEIIRALSGYDTVFVSGINATVRNGILKYCVANKKDCYFVPHTGDVIIAGGEHVHNFSVPIIHAKRCSPSPEFLFIKRTFDILLSLIAIVVTSPFMAVTAIAIKAYDHGPALYKQVRLTKDGKKFNILKFRSMRVDAEKDGVARLSSGDSDDRITPIGRVIRAIRFDELPQLFCILSGDMSIVGPRPERPEIAEQYEKELPSFGLRLQVKAGLTGYAQIYGKYNTEPADKLKMDLMYINNISVLEDLKLMFATIRILFMKDSTEGVDAKQTTALNVEPVETAETETEQEPILLH